MNVTKTLAPKRASTAKRMKREAEIASGLEFLHKQNPDGFAHLMKVLARLVVNERVKKK